MLVAVAVCPHPPLLVPELAVGQDAQTEALRSACLRAAELLVAAPHDEVVVVGAGPIAGSPQPGSIGSLAPYGVDMSVCLAGIIPPRPQPGASALPLSVTIGVWALRQAGYPRDLRARVVTDSDKPDECRDLGARMASFPVRTALLVMGDGSARRTEASPGYVDPRSEVFDDAVADALGSADTAALAVLDPALAAELLAMGRAPWQVLAGAAAGSAWRAELLYADAPFGVGYFVAHWTPARQQDRPASG